MGRIAASFGVQGWLRLKPFTEDPGGLDEYAQWIVRSAGGLDRHAAGSVRAASKGRWRSSPAATIATLPRGLRGCDVAVTREALGEAEEGTLYRVDLVGCR
jgi:16S rRNA processing protein RimM